MKNKDFSPILIVDRYTRHEVLAHRDTHIYVFGDNTHDRTVTKHIPMYTQAQIRGLDNTMGIDTKRNRRTDASAFFSNKDIGIYQRYIDKVMIKLTSLRDEGKTIVFPRDGIGTGLALLKIKAPLLFNYLGESLYREFGFINGDYKKERGLENEF